MTEFQNEHDLDAILRKVRGLLDTANHENTPPEMADNYRLKAEALMFKYRLDEATAAGYHGDSKGGMKPLLRSIVLGDAGSEFEDYYRQLAGAVMYHVGARALVRRESDPVSQTMKINLKAVGFESDLRYMDVLLTSSLLEFSKRLEPSFNGNLSLAENIYNMRHAGMERKRIARVVFGEWATENEMKAKNRKVTRIFKEESHRRGENPDDLLGRGNNMETYRRSYAQGFVNQLYTRLERMRQSHGAESGALVLAGRKEMVDEEFYENFPHMRPKESPPTTNWHQIRADCPKCQRAQSGYCREHQWMKPSNAQMRGPSLNYNAYGRGQDAARAVDLGPGATGTPKAPHQERKGLR